MSARSVAIADDRSLRARSDTAGAWQLTVHLGVLGAAGGAQVLASGPLRLAAFAVYAAALVFLFAALHECIHRSAFRRRWLNDAVARVSGFALLLPAEYFRAFHLAHHRHTQDPRHDPELAVPRPARLRDYLLHLSGLPYWRERVTTLVRHAGGRVNEPFVASRRRAVLRREARAHLALYALLGLATAGAAGPLLLQFWVLPALAGMPLLRAFLLAEHAGCPLRAPMHRNSRTTYTNAVLRRLSWNMSYHTAHHCAPAVPFHQLARLHARLTPPAAVQAHGYWRFHREWLGRMRARGSAPH